MLDINFIRDNVEAVKEAAKNKGVSVDIEALLAADQQRRELQQKVDRMAHERKELAERYKGKPSEQVLEQGKKMKEEMRELEGQLKKVEQEFTELMETVPNIPTEDTPVGEDESANKVVRQVGNVPKFDFKAKEHWELGEALDVIDTERAAEVVGSRFSYLKGELVQLQFALIQFALSVLTSEKILKKIAKQNKLQVSTKPFVPVLPPVMVRPQILRRMARLEPQEERYHIESDDLFLVGSAEHTLGPLHMNETLKEEQLPIRYVGYSTSFRREAGSYGKDVRGILRVHQFDKLEMESFSLPEQSIEEQNFIVAIQEYLMQSLELAYQVVSISTGDMGGPDARQIDIETWLPGQDKYRETHTSDLMTDYQARRLRTKVRRTDGKSEYVHMNDATAFAGRTLIAIMENYQREDGSIDVPKVLQKYLSFDRIVRDK